jgi:hypothetical protein
MKQKEHPTAARKPVHEIRFGASRIAIWRNESGYPSLTASRLYKDADGQWRDASSFDRDDIPQLIKALDAAYEWLFANRS